MIADVVLMFLDEENMLTFLPPTIYSAVHGVLASEERLEQAAAKLAIQGLGKIGDQIPGLSFLKFMDVSSVINEIESLVSTFSGFDLGKYTQLFETLLNSLLSNYFMGSN